MRSPFAYARRAGPLGSAGPGAATAYMGSLALIALALGNPLLIAAAGVAAVLAGIISSAGAALAGAWRWALALGVLMVLVNALVVRRGDTVLIRGFDLPVLGPLDITLEAIAEGGVLALRVIVVLLAFAVLSACVDPDRMLRAVRPLARRSALTATLITRLVPLAGRDHARLREAAGSRGPVASDVGRGALVSRLVAGSLERASDVAATIELRGYGLRPAAEPTGSSPAGGEDRAAEAEPRAARRGEGDARPRPRPGRRSRSYLRSSPRPHLGPRPRYRSVRNNSSLLLYGLAATTLATGVIAGTNGLAGFEAYPRIEIAAGLATIGVALFIALLPLTLLPLRSVMPARRWPLPPAQRASEASAESAAHLLNGVPRRPVLEMAELSYRYPGHHADCLDRVDVTVSPGELVLLGGPSGSGKTSLLRAACGLIPHFHGGTIAGRIVVAGREVREHGPAELAAAVGYVAQDPETQVVSAIAGSEVEMPLVSRGVADEKCKLEVAAVTAELGIAQLLERPTDSLSAGELQRVAIAAALASGPRLLLLDEPTSQLDPDAADALIGAVGRLRARGTAIVVVEHRMDRWLTLADRVLRMDSGRVANADPVAGAAVVSGSRGRAASSAAASTGSFFIKPVQGGAAPLAPGGFRDLMDPAEPVGPIESGEPAETVATALDLTDVSLTLDSSRPPVLQHVDVRVERGERVALLGANGAGKSSLLRVAAGLAAPSSGSSGAPGGCALLGQHPGDYLVRDRVADELPGELGAQALNAVGLRWAAELDPRDLSGGERQRLALALTLAGRGLGGSPPGLVCLDEPTRGMDSERKGELAALILRLSGEGAAVIVATHDLAFAASFAQRAIVIERGAVAADCDFQDLPGPAGLYEASEPVPSRRLGDNRGGDAIGAGIAAMGSGELP